MKYKVIAAALLCLLFFTGCGGQKELTPPEGLPKNYSLDQAKTDNCVVIEDSALTSGQEAWGAFEKAAGAGKTAFVRLYQQFALGGPSGYDPEYYESIKDDYPLMFVRNLSYDGERFAVVRYKDVQRLDSSHSLLRRFEEESRSNAEDYDAYVFYVLTDDAEITYDQLWAPLDSSQCLPLESRIPFDILYFIYVRSETNA